MGRLGIGIGIPGRGGVLPFSPLSIAGCVLWLRADLGITKDGSDNVSAWADQSGAGHNVQQAVGANQPLFTTGGPLAGGPVVRGDGSNDFLRAAFTLAQPYELWVVFRQRALSGATNDLWDGNTVNTGRMIQNAHWQMYAGAAACDRYPDVQWHFARQVWDSVGGGSLFDLDYGTAQTGNPGAASPGGLTLCSDGGNVFPSQLDVAEAWIIDRAVHVPSVAEISALKAYARARYALPRSVLPLGDSITLGLNGDGGYDGGYRLRLLNQHNTRRLFIGTQDDPSASGNRCEGHTANTIANLNGNWPTYWGALGNTSDEVWIMAGTPDVEFGATAAQMLVDLTALIGTVVTSVPAPSSVRVLSIPPLLNGAWNAVRNTYNAGIPGVVAGFQSVSFLDACAGMTAATHIGADAVHPNSAGYDLIASNIATEVG